MGSLLAKFIYPHFHNNHRPYALRHRSLFLFIILLAGTQVASNIVSGDLKILGYSTNISKDEIISLTNSERGSKGLSRLKENVLLSEAAALKATDMFEDDYWAHFAPDGTSPWYFFKQTGYSYSWAGENLARDFQSSTGVMAGWMSSTAGHKENILNNNFTEIGVAVRNGILQGEETTLVVQLFAKPVSYLASTPSEESVAEGTKVKDSFTLESGEEVESSSADEQVVTKLDEGVVGGSEGNTIVLSALENLSTSQKTSFGLLFILGSLFAADSVVIFRRKHDRENSHSGIHASVVLILMATLLAQSIGSIV